MNDAITDPWKKEYKAKPEEVKTEDQSNAEESIPSYSGETKPPLISKIEIERIRSAIKEIRLMGIDIIGVEHCLIKPDAQITERMQRSEEVRE